MKKHITILNNMGGPARKCQEDTEIIAHNMGFRELSLFYSASTGYDNDDQLRCRIEGITSAMSIGDLTIFQYPTFMGHRFDGALAERLKIFNNKLIIFVTDIVVMLMGKKEDIENTINYDIEIFNKAHVLILASKKLHIFLLEHGLNKDIPVVYQTMWDYRVGQVITEHKPIRRMLLTGGDKIIDYYGKNTIYQFCRQNVTEEKNNVKWMGYYDFDSLNVELAKGGFGLCWCTDEQFEKYDCMNQSFKFSAYISSGLPVFIRKGDVHEEFVKNNNIGFAVSSLQEADKILSGLSDDEFNELYDNVKNIQTLVTNGEYTTRALNEAVIKLFDKTN